MCHWNWNFEFVLSNDKPTIVVYFILTQVAKIKPICAGH